MSKQTQMAPERLWADPADAKVGDGVCFVTFDFPVTTHNVEYVRADIVAEMQAALRSAEEWLSGWASAEPYLSKIRAALATGEAR